jgi:hypothetical protein
VSGRVLHDGADRRGSFGFGGVKLITTDRLRQAAAEEGI